MREIRIFDDFISNGIDLYRVNALKREFKTFVFPEATFHGISISQPPPSLDAMVAMFSRLALRSPVAASSLSFFRKSPLGQEEPHFIHTDVDMGDWSAILYLNPDPPKGDGTSFWTHRASGEIENPIPHMRSEVGRTAAGWDLRQRVQAKFNRMVLFPSSFFHSRSIPENWGEGDEARLTQVTFGTGDLFS